MHDVSDKSLWFKINEDKGGEVVYFKRLRGKLWKLGDGTFGVVYVVHSDLRDNDFAVKLLYDNDSTTPRPLSRLPLEAVSAITTRVLEEEQWPEERATALLNIVVSKYQTPDSLALALSTANLPEWELILQKIRKRANSTAVERFNRESRVSSIIRADQLRRSAQAQVSGTVDIIGSTQRFQSYPAYEQLRDEFATMGVSVSDYALVMDKYEFSMKDLLERGPGEAYWIKPAILEEVFVGDGVPESLSGIFTNRADLERVASEQTALDDAHRQRLSRGHRHATGGLRTAEADDLRGPHPHGPALSARYRGWVEPAPQGDLCQWRASLSSRHQAGEHLRQTGRGQGTHVCVGRSRLPPARATTRSDDGCLGR